jgi:hypothetical protein
VSDKKHVVKENNHPSYCTAFPENTDNAVDKISTQLHTTDNVKGITLYHDARPLELHNLICFIASFMQTVFFSTETACT